MNELLFNAKLGFFLRSVMCAPRAMGCVGGNPVMSFLVSMLFIDWLDR